MVSFAKRTLLTTACRPRPRAPSRARATSRIYELYADFVLKNPFYEVEQVIKCELFDEAVDALLRRYPTMLQG